VVVVVVVGSVLVEVASVVVGAAAVVGGVLVGALDFLQGLAYSP
jgi:hypothetical protein